MVWCDADDNNNNIPLPRLTHIEYLLQNGKSLRRIPQWLFKCAVHHPLNRDHVIVSGFVVKSSSSLSCYDDKRKISDSDNVGFTTTRLLVWLQRRHHFVSRSASLCHSKITHRTSFEWAFINISSSYKSRKTWTVVRATHLKRIEVGNEERTWHSFGIWKKHLLKSVTIL